MSIIYADASVQTTPLKETLSSVLSGQQNVAPFVFGSPITTNAPSFPSTTHPLAVSSKISGRPGPYPTNSWMQNFLMGTNRVEPVPYQVKQTSSQLWVCYPNRTVNTTSITTAILQNMAFEASEGISSIEQIAEDLMSATYKWKNGSNYMQSAIVQGSPYMVMQYSGLTPKITTQHAILSVNGSSTPGEVSGTKFKVVLNNGQTWLIYTSSTVTFTWSNTGGWQLLAGSAFTGTVSMAYMLDAAHETILDTYKDAYPTGVTINATVSGDVATLTYTYTVAGSGQLLMMALPHHMETLQNPTTVATAYKCMKGTTTGVVGSTWTFSEPLPTIGWSAPRAIDPNRLTAVVNALASDYTFVTSQNTDVYNFGKEIAKMARLALIADEVGETSKRDTVIANMKTWLNKWLDGTNGNPLKYDSTYGGICSTAGLASPSADYGNGYYNDHHFHYGYPVYAAAVIAKFDSAWRDSYRGKVTDLIRDYMNPSTSDNKFTRFRHKDFYAGHSWASGLSDFGDNRNQESSSESINAYYGAYLWGLATNDTNIKETARILLAMEIRATKKYYHIYPGNNVYDAGYTGKGIGVLWQTKVDDATFFGSNLEYRRMIQVIPITPITEFYVESGWASEIWTEMQTIIAAASDGWKNFIYAVEGVIAKVQAWIDSNLLGSFDNGNSKTNQLYWEATRA